MKLLQLSEETKPKWGGLTGPDLWFGAAWRGPDGSDKITVVDVFLCLTGKLQVRAGHLGSV